MCVQRRLDELTELRLLADRYGDARLYRSLAEWYRELGFEANAQACEKRAEWYEREQEREVTHG